MLLFAFIFVNALSAFAGPGKTTYQAKIVKPDGYPLEVASVNFKFTILDPAGSCILYSETYSSVNMSGTSGLISFALGSGVKTYPVSATTFEQVFSNITPSLSCDVGGPTDYTPAASDIRKIVMQFHDGSGWQTLPAMSINAVPYAMYANEATKLNGLTSSDFVQLSTVPTCTASEALRYTGAGFTCVAVGSGGSTTSSTIITALGYTPADGVSVTALTSNVSSVSSTVFSVSSTVTSLQNSVAASFAAITSSQWTTSGTNIFYNTGNIGIGTTAPVVALDVSGGVRIGAESTTCAPALAGTLRYNASNVEYCNGTSWQAFGVSGSGITNFNGSTSGTQSFATGSGGTAPNFNTSNGVHTLNIPLASTGSVTAGLLSNADYTTFTNKITSGAASIAQVLGYVPADNAASGTYAQKVNNLSDLTNIATARTNLGLGTFATASSIDLGSASATGTLAIARLPSFSGDATIVAASNTIILSNSGVTAGTYTKVTVDAKGRVTSGSQVTSSDVITALGYTPANSATVVSSQWSTSGTTINYTTGNVGIGTTSSDAALHVSGSNGTTLKIVDTNQGVGKVLTSDASGVASWQTPVTVFNSVRVATNANITLSGVQTIDGVAVNAGDRVLVKNQTTASQNGIYTVAAGAWTRASDFNTWSQTIGYKAQVTEGTYFAGMTYASTTGVGGTLGATAINWNSQGSGAQNITAFGYKALNMNVGSNNTAFGTNTLAVNDAGFGNTAFGSSALSLNTSGNNNTAMGLSALSKNTTGWNNHAYGAYALYNNTTGFQNTAIGQSALSANTTGTKNTAVGDNTLANATADANVAVGASAMSNSTTGNTNVAVGASALYSNTTGSQNTAIGYGAAENTTTGFYNVALGYRALYSNKAKSDSVSIGNESMFYTDNSTSGGSTYNTAVGAYSLRGTSPASGNTGIKNTALGHSALNIVTTGSNNLALGWSAGSAITTGSNNVVIGSNTGSAIATSSNNILIADGAGNERIRVDSSGNVGIGTTTPTAKLHLASGTTSVAPLKLTSGTLLTSPQSGTVEYDGTNFYVTDGTNTRRAIAANTNPGTYDNVSNINSSGNITLTPTGSVVVSSTTASTNSSTGALVVKGGLGVAGNINTAANINVSGSSVIDGSLKLSSMTNGSVLFAGANGVISQDNSNFYWDGSNKRLGIGTASPGAPLDVISPNNGTTGGLRIRRPAADAAPAYLQFTNNAGSSEIANIVADTSANLIFSVSAAERVRITSAGTVGIGTTSPEEKFHISNGWGLFDNGYGVRFKSASGTITNALRTGTSDQLVVGSGLWNSISFHTGTADKMVIASSGNVGIGTTSPSRKLEVSGTVAVSDKLWAGYGNNNILGYSWTDSAFTTNSIEIVNNNGAVSGSSPTLAFHRYGTGGPQFRLDATGTNVLYLESSGPNAARNPNAYGGNSNSFFSRLHIDGGLTTVGSVGIGTSAPTQKLEIVGGNLNIPTGYAYFNAGTTAGTQGIASSDSGSIYGEHDSGTETSRLVLEIFDNPNDQIVLRTNAQSGGSNIDMVRVQYNTVMLAPTSGNVGIGITTPGAKLDVKGDDINNTFRTTDASGQYRARIDQFYDFYMTSASGTDTLVIKNSGNVGIGTMSPSRALQVGSAGGWSDSSGILLKGSNPGLEITDTQATPQRWLIANGVMSAGDGKLGLAYNINTSTHNLVVQPNGNIGIGTSTPSYKLDVNGTIRGFGITDSSDIRLKKDIQLLDLSLEKILKIDGVSYNWKDPSMPKKQIGFIAQQLEKIYPELVETDKEGMKSVNYSHLVAPIVEAIKSLYQHIQGLEEGQKLQNRQIASMAESKADKKEIEKLKTENAELKARLDKIEKAFNSK